MVHIFVAEDSKLIRKAIRSIIEEYACKVTESSGSIQTIKEFEQEVSGIMFLDVQVPDDKGLAAVYELINSHPEAKVDAYKTDPEDVIRKGIKKGIAEPKQGTGIIIEEGELDRFLETGLESAVKSISTMLNKDIGFNIVRKNITKKGSIVRYVPASCLGVFYQLSGDADGGASLMFPLNDILATVGLFQIDFTIREGTTQNIINELGNIFVSAILGVLNEKLRKKFILGVPAPATGDKIEAHFEGVGGDDDDVMVLKFNFVIEEKTIDAYLIFSAGIVAG